MDSPLVIEFDNSKGKNRLLFSGNAVQSWDPVDRVIETVSPEALKVLTDDLQKDLTTLRESLQHAVILKGQEELVGDRLEEFYAAGRTFWRNFIRQRDPTLLLSRLRDSLTKGLPPQWWDLSPDKIAANVATVEVKGWREVLLPIDALPLGNRERLSYTADPSDVRALASLFGGYCCVVRYVSYGKDDARPAGHSFARSMLPPAPTVDPKAVVYLRSEGATYYDDMWKYLKGQWHVLGPFPRRGELEDGGSIARCLLNPDAMYLADSRSYVHPGITHIHAHAKMGKGFARKLYIKFCYGSKTVEFISADVELALEQLEAAPNSCGPLVVFSACHAQGGLQPPLANTAFDLAEAGCRAVVGPRDAIPAGVAYAFSRDLYNGLSLRDEVGRAVVRCRWNLLRSFNNPLGILYSVFGNTGKL